MKSKSAKVFHLFDIASVYAYTDLSLSRDRELWRGFLSCILPIIFPKYAENIDNVLIASVSDSIEDLMEVKDPSTNQAQAIRVISTHIAEYINVPKELALASFYDNDYAIHMPTKLFRFNHFPVKRSTREIREEQMIGQWISRFHKICNQRDFLLYIDLWKDWLA